MIDRPAAEALLRQWRASSEARDNLVRLALSAGLSRSRIHVLTGISRTTIDRIVPPVPRTCPCCSKPVAEHSPAEGLVTRTIDP